MKKIVIPFGMVFIAVALQAQDPEFHWARQFESSPQTNFLSATTSITVDPMGNVYTTGYFSDTIDLDPGPGTFLLTSGANPDSYVSKMDASGHLVWAAHFSGEGDIYSLAIDLDDSGNVYTTGYFSDTADFDPGLDSFLLSCDSCDNAFGGNVFISKLDPSGEFVWAKKMGTTGHAYAGDMTIADSGHIYLTGYFTGSIDFDPDTGVADTFFLHNPYSLADRDIFVSKLGPDGSFIWAKQLGGSAAITTSRSIEVDDAGNVYTTGFFTDTVDFDPGPGLNTFYMHAYYNMYSIFVSKLDASGNFVWAKRMGGPNGYCQGYSIALDDSANVYTTGYFTHTADFDPGPGTYALSAVPNIYNDSLNDIFVSKLDTDGDFVWAKGVGSSSYDQGNCVTIDDSGDIYLTGYYSGVADFDPGTAMGDTFYLPNVGGPFQAFILKLEASGNFAWAKRIGGYGSSSDAMGRSITVDDFGHVYTTGGFWGTVDFDPGPGSFDLVTNSSSDSYVHKMRVCPSGSTTYDTVYPTVCESYASVDSQTIWTTSGVYHDTTFNTTGCDSIITINLTVLNNTFYTDVQTACSTYTWMDGNTYTSSNNTATYTLPNAAGCDSIITLDLTILGDSVVDVLVACDAHTWIDGNTYTTNNNTATYTLTNTAGCDSVVTLDLTVNYATTATDIVTACDSFNWIDGNTYTANNNTATHTLTNTAGCDSVVTLDLTMNYSTTATDAVTACDAFNWIDGNTYTASNNTATHTLTNTAGCDSVITLDLTLNHSTSGIDSVAACGPYTWMDGNTYTTDNNTATHTLANAAGCDSLVTLDLIILNDSVVDVQEACDAYTWIDGNTYTSNNNTATYTLTNATGCDSVVTLDLTVNHATAAIDIVTACDSFTWMDGNTYTANNNTATYTLTNAAGCDSVVTLDLTVNHATTATDVVTACGSHTWIDGITYTSSNNTAVHVLTNAVGCDSTVALNLTIDTVDTSVNASGPVLTAVQSGAGYQWLDCSEGYAPIANEMNQSFTATNGGSYAVEITYESCTDTSSCRTTGAAGMIENTFGQAVSIHPNPTEGGIRVDLGKSHDAVQIRVRDLRGRLLQQQTYARQDHIFMTLNHAAGIYFVEVSSGAGQAIFRVVKQ